MVQGQYFLDLYGMDSSPILALRALHVALLVYYEKLRSLTEYARRRASDELLSTELRQMSYVEVILNTLAHCDPWLTYYVPYTAAVPCHVLNSPMIQRAEEEWSWE